MIEEDYGAWLDRVYREWEGIGAAMDGFAGTRDAMLGLWLLMRGAPENVRDLYRELDEDTLQAEALEASTRQGLPDLPSRDDTTAHRDLLWRLLATELRVTELRVEALDDRGTLRRDAQCKADWDGKEAYVVPGPARNRVASTRHPFSQRALVRMRILPFRYGSYRVRVTFPELPMEEAPPAAGALGFGACLFKGFELVLGEDEGGFVVRAARAEAQLDTIRECLSQGVADGCLAVVFPELAIDGATLETVEARIGDAEWTLDRIGIVVLGSRHEEVGGRRYNVAPVIDRYGKRLVDYRKRHRFSDTELRESITLGDTIEVVALPEALVAFGICLDFCNFDETVYPNLDVDYILVPSCGDEKTMTGHVEKSSDLIRRMKTRSFVVQQHHDDGTRAVDHIGYVLARCGKTTPTEPDTRRRETFTRVEM